MQRGNKSAKINFINSGAVGVTRTAYYMHGPELMKLIPTPCPKRKKANIFVISSRKLGGF